MNVPLSIGVRNLSPDIPANGCMGVEFTLLPMIDFLNGMRCLGAGYGYCMGVYDGELSNNA